MHQHARLIIFIEMKKANNIFLYSYTYYELMNLNMSNGLQAIASFHGLLFERISTKPFWRSNSL